MSFAYFKRSFYTRVAYDVLSPVPTKLELSDIVLHLPVLEYYASLCGHVTEFGVREGCSTVALLSGCRGKVSSFDIKTTPIVRALRSIELPCAWEFTELDTSQPDDRIGETEMLFFDTLHTREHLSKELHHHGRKASRFLAFHDTFVCAERDLSGPDPTAEGILPAINEFLREHRGYETVYRTEANNGLWILERCA